MATITARIELISYDHVALRWEVAPAPTAPVAFKVYRSGNPVTGFEQVAETETPFLTDVFDLTSRFRPFFYRIEGVIDGELVKSDPIGQDAQPNVEALLLAKRERFQLAKYDGNPMWLFVKRQWGKVCPICVTTSHGPVTDTCPRCYGTRFEGGFYPPVPVYASFKAPNNQRGSLQPTHVEESERNMLWTSNWALISSGDVLIEASNPFLVWHVDNVSRTAYNRSSISQNLQVNSVERGHVYYDLPRPSFAWPRHDEIWYESFTQGIPAFDALWAARVRDYLATNPSTIHHADPLDDTPPPPPLEVGPGEFDPMSGGFR